jgi:hypothetical protein
MVLFWRRRGEFVITSNSFYSRRPQQHGRKQRFFGVSGTVNTGAFNAFFGYQSGLANTGGNNNAFSVPALAGQTRRASECILRL